MHLLLHECIEQRRTNEKKYSRKECTNGNLHSIAYAVFMSRLYRVRVRNHRFKFVNIAPIGNGKFTVHFPSCKFTVRNGEIGTRETQLVSSSLQSATNFICYRIAIAQRRFVYFVFVRIETCFSVGSCATKCILLGAEGVKERLLQTFSK